MLPQCFPLVDNEILIAISHILVSGHPDPVSLRICTLNEITLYQHQREQHQADGYKENAKTLTRAQVRTIV